MALSVLALLALALLPSRWTGWVGWLRGPALAALTPASAPMRALGEWLRPAERAGASDDPLVAALESELERFKTLYRREQQEAERLRGLLSELQRGRALNPDVAVAVIPAEVVGVATDLSTLQVRAGADRGVTRDTVAVASGVHLVGRVVEVGGRVSSALPITHVRAGWLRGAVDVPGAERMPGCQLRATGDGETLRGELDADASGVAAGQTVRLRDENWPEGAQMLTLGVITRVGPKESQPLRLEIVVKPALDLRRVGRVALWVPASEGGAGGGPLGGGER